MIIEGHRENFRDLQAMFENLLTQFFINTFLTVIGPTGKERNKNVENPFNLAYLHSRAPSSTYYAYR